MKKPRKHGIFNNICYEILASLQTPNSWKRLVKPQTHADKTKPEQGFSSVILPILSDKILNKMLKRTRSDQLMLMQLHQTSTNLH